MKKARNRSAIHCIAALAAFLTSFTAQAAWDEVIIPGITTDTHLQRVWARDPSEVFVWGNLKTGDIVNSHLYRFYNNQWSLVLTVPGDEPMALFGVGANEVYAATAKTLWRSTDNGTSWLKQTPPMQGDFGRISGTLNNVHVTRRIGELSYILRFDGNSWQPIYISSYAPHGLRVLGDNEAYFVGCWGTGTWSGPNANYIFHHQGFDMCDVYDTYVVRGQDGKLNWWAVGNNNFANGIRIWRFNNTTASFGGKNVFEFSDGNGYNIGSATAIWGSSENDVYVVGNLATSSGGIRSGRVYRYNGESWTRLTDVGDIIPESVWGTSKENVWISGRNGKLLRLRALIQPRLNIALYPGLEIKGEVGASYEIQFASAPDSKDWQTLDHVTTDSSPYLYFDRSSPGAVRRFYRVVLK